MASLDDLIAENLAAGMRTPDQQNAAIEARVAAAMPAMLRKYGQTSQQQNEAAFGKGMGLSTWNAYQQALNSLMEAEGAGTIRDQAAQSVEAAQRAAVGNAASYASAEKNRAVNQATANQSAQLARRGQDQAARLQNQGMVFQGLGGLAGGAAGIGARMFQPEIKSGLKDLYSKAFGGGPRTPGQPGAPATEQSPNMENAIAAAGGDTAGYQSPAPDTSAFPSGLNFYQDSAPMPSYGGGYSFDLPALNINPSSWGGGLEALLQQQPDYNTVAW